MTTQERISYILI